MAAQINLLPKKELAESALGKLLKFSLTYGRYIIVGTQLIVLLAFFSRFKLDRELTDLQDSVEQKYAIVTSLTEFESEVRLLQERIDQIRELKENHNLIRLSLESIKSILPPGNTLLKLNIGEENITATGVSQNEQSLAFLINQVNSSDLFSSVEFGRINKRKDSGEIDFSVTLKLNNQQK